jgi:NOL1/NOP2/fmu family ribosome biogenesis protein
MKEKIRSTMSKEVFQWGRPETNLDEVYEDIKRILQDDYDFHENGYELARKLEDLGYSPDTELVEILDSVSYKMYIEIDEATKKWVITDNITPEFEIETEVYYTKNKKQISGIIKKIFVDDAKYGIYSEGMEKNSLAVIPYENCSLKQ